MNQKKFLFVATFSIITILFCATVMLSSRSIPSADAKAIAPPERPLDEKSAEVRVSLPFYRRLSEHYQRGAVPLSGGIETLMRLGVKTLVDLRSVYEHTQEIGIAAERRGLRYYWLPMSVWNAPSDIQAREFVTAVTEESKGPFYVFCSDGLNRTGEMSAIYRIAHHGWTVERALAEVDEIGFNPYYYTLRNYVWTYARKFYPEAVPPSARRLSSFER